MRNYQRLLVTTAAISLLAGLAYAQTQPEKVTVSITMNQATLFGPGRDTFVTVVNDRSGKTTLTLNCSAAAGGIGFGVGSANEACNVSGAGTIKNPNNPTQEFPRIAYQGGFVIDSAKDGYTAADTIKATYLAVGSAPAANDSFKGSVMMKPKKPASAAAALVNQVVAKAKAKLPVADQVKIDSNSDSIQFNDLAIPHTGQLGGVSCTWSGVWVYPYVNHMWQIQVDANCAGKHYKLEGNLPLSDAPAGSEHEEELAINLLVPGNGGDPFAAPDPFANVDGITGTLKLDESGRTKDIDGEKNYEKVVVTGELTGKGLPLEVVRGFAEILGMYVRTILGA